MNWLFSILLGLAGVLLIGQTVNMHTMRRGDGFSRSMAVSLGGLCTCVVCGLIAVLLGLAKAKSTYPSFSGWAALIILPTGFAAMLRVNYLMRSYEHSRWLIACVVMPVVLLMTLSAVIRFEKALPWLENDGVNGLVWSVTTAFAAIPFFAGRKAKPVNQSSPETS